MIKLLMVTHYFDSHQGGIEVVARRLFDGLAGRQCEVEWAAAGISDPPPLTTGESVLPLRTWNGCERVVGVPFPVPSPGAIKKLHTAVRRSHAVLLHDCLYLSNIIAFLCARLYSIPVILVQHVGFVPYKNPALRFAMKAANALIARPMLRAASQSVFISKITERHFSSVSFRNPPLTIFNGVDTDVFRPPRSLDEKSALRDKFGLPSAGPVALFVGRFVEKKGLPLLREMAQSECGITWAFAGSGPLDPKDWQLNNVHVYSDLRGKGTADLYRCSDIFVLPSSGEGFPLVVQEALASGLPVVCSEETVCADSKLAEFVHGVPLNHNSISENASEFTKAIRELLSRPQDSGWASKCQTFVRERYSWAHAIDRYIQVLESIVACTGKSPLNAALAEPVAK